jgi:hypothetical protein
VRRRPTLKPAPGVADERGYFVCDASIENTDEGPVVHVELISVSEIEAALDDAED